MKTIFLLIIVLGNLSLCYADQLWCRTYEFLSLEGKYSAHITLNAQIISNTELSDVIIRNEDYSYEAYQADLLVAQKKYNPKKASRRNKNKFTAGSIQFNPNFSERDYVTFYIPKLLPAFEGVDISVRGEMELQHAQGRAIGKLYCYIND